MELSDVIKILNSLHAAELVAAHQYRVHAISYKGPNSKSVQAELRSHADEEDGHARILEGLIDDLGGDLYPSMADIPRIAFNNEDSRTSEDKMEMLEQDYHGEEAAIDAYGQAILLLKDTEWFDVAVVLAGIQRDEREHSRDIQDLLS
jgi:bacterioferritin